MPPPARRSIVLEPGTPIADALTRARQAFTAADATGVDAAYQESVRLARGNTTLWAALVMDHIEQLRMLHNATLALRRCDEYLGEAGASHLSLWVQRAEIRSCLHFHSGAGEDAAKIRAALAGQSGSLTREDSARLHRVEGLSAADRDDLDGAVAHLDAAREVFRALDDQAGVAAIELDKLQLGVREGEQPAVSDVLSGPPPRTAAESLLRALALRRQLRYQEAFEVLLRGAVNDDLDPALRWSVLYELILLLRLLNQNSIAERLLPLLDEAVVLAADPVTAAVDTKRLSDGAAPSDVVSPHFDRRVQWCRRLISDTRLAEAERVLTELCSHARTERDVSTWHLAAGECALARYELSGTRSFAEEAVGHLSNAADHASVTALVEVQACALGLLGDACQVLGDAELAAVSWAAAHRLEEEIAGRQPSDNVRIGMLLPVPDEYDKRIEAAAKALGTRGLEAAAAIAVAMEAARGAAILDRILPGQPGLGRDLPEPGDLRGALRWVDDVGDGLSRSQVAWIIHSTPDHVHHAVIGRERFDYTSVPSPRTSLMKAVNDFAICCSTTEILEECIADGQFAKLLNEIADRVGVSAVIEKIPRHVRRIAIVAGGELSNIPFAGMLVPGEAEPIGLRFALSDLPCLSARLPLHQRSRRSRGDRLLVVSPPTQGLTRAESGRGKPLLDGERATVAALREELERHRHQQVRIDCHGQHDRDDPTRGSWLQLTPEGPAGQLRPEELQRMDLEGYGTVILGACESGMAQRIGRDERIGFVRAAVHAGASAAIAATWRAVDGVAAPMIDRITWYLHYLPRDLALQRAQRDVYRGALAIPGNIPFTTHPARWACWTLYGDSGWQTGAGLVRRLLRCGLDQRRRRAAHP